MLRNRIFFGVAPLIVLLMMVGGYAVWLFLRLGNAVNPTLHDNYVSIVAMRDLKDAAERIERTLSGGQTAGSQSTLEQQTAICRHSLDTESAIITEPGEREAAERLRARGEAFLQAASRTAAAGGDLRRPLDELL